MLKKKKCGHQKSTSHSSTLSSKQHVIFQPQPDEEDDSEDTNVDANELAGDTSSSFSFVYQKKRTAEASEKIW